MKIGIETFDDLVQEFLLLEVKVRGMESDVDYAKTQVNSFIDMLKNNIIGGKNGRQT